ncbi:D-alanyl-D-alanine carboxypeptidase family protein [Vibrionales bacterium C3R12]|nr:D-alanyl-D-alanine carboxypeptidase family protein [Vibrionales bacterium C3R12]
MTPEQLTGQTNDHLVPVTIGQKEFLIHPNVQNDLLALSAAAQQAGFQMHIASGFRDYARQKAIWDNKFSGHSTINDTHNQAIPFDSMTEEQRIFAILRWSALPGASRHHWGTDFDLFAADRLPENTKLQLETWEYDTGHQAEFSIWLKANLGTFGFFIPYSQDLGGVAVEPWHISHRLTAASCLEQLTQDQLACQIKTLPILGQELVLQNLPTIYTQYVTNIRS